MLQLYKIQNLGSELQNQMMKSETLKKFMLEDLESCEQRAKSCKTDLKQAEEGKTLQRSFQQQMKKRLGEVMEKLNMMESEKNQIQNEKLSVESKLQSVLAEVSVKDKERENALKEAQKYHELYLKGNDLLNSMREENKMIQSKTAKPVGEIVSALGNNSLKVRVEREDKETANQEKLSSEKQTQGQNEAKEKERKETTKKTEQEIKEEGELKENVNAEEKKTEEVKKEESEKEMKGVETRKEKREATEKKKEEVVVKEEAKKEEEREAAEKRKEEAKIEEEEEENNNAREIEVEEE